MTRRLASRLMPAMLALTILVTAAAIGGGIYILHRIVYPYLMSPGPL